MPRIQCFHARPRDLALEDSHPCLLGLRPWQIDDGARFALDQGVGLGAPLLDIAGSHQAFDLEACRVGADRIAARPVRVELVIDVAVIIDRWIFPRRMRIAAEIQHVVMVRVSAHSHRDQLDERGTEAGARPFGRPCECRGDDVRIVAVERDARDAVAGGLVSEHADRGLLADWRRESGLIVLDAEDRRQPPRRAQVDRLVPLAERRAAVSDERDGDAADPSRQNASAMPAMVSVAMVSGAAGGKMPHPRSPTFRSLPSDGGPALAICAFSTIRTVAGSLFMARVTPRSRMTGATTSPSQRPSGVRCPAPRFNRIAAA